MGEATRIDRAPTVLVVARLRWLGVVLGIVQAYLTSPPPVSRTAVVAASVLLGLYSLPLMAVRRLPRRVADWLVPASLVGDFLICTALVMLLANDEFSTAYVIYALVAIEAAVLYRWRGALVFIAAFAVAMVALYAERAIYFGFVPLPGSAIFRGSIVVLIAMMSGGITSAAQATAVEARRQAARAEVLAVVAGRVAQTLRREYVLDTVMDSLAGLFPDRWHGILLIQPGGRLVLEYQRGEPSGLKLEYSRSPIPEGTAALVIPDLRDWTPPDPLEQPPPELGGHRAAAILPLRATEVSFGVLVSVDRAPGAFSPDQVAFLEALAGQASTALENARLYEEVELLSLTDVTTALLNRRALDSRLLEEFFRAQRYDLPLSLLMIDVDHFKVYNDTHGHLSGDRVLRRLGEVLAREALRRVDIPFRYGGEEFAVLMPMTPPEQAMQVAQRIREAVAAEPFEGRESQPNGFLSVSIGLASYPHHGAGAHDLLEAADQALYAAKQGGRDRVVRFDPADSGRATFRYAGTAMPDHT
ncbi:MAG TPA: diguanylate cyclase [Candidatus Dormibacteraeota bacterium]|nr:diguanylate cyclase [Candidatus Dormibacteraeota bacterium]